MTIAEHRIPPCVTSRRVRVALVGGTAVAAFDVLGDDLAQGGSVYFDVSVYTSAGALQSFLLITGKDAAALVTAPDLATPGSGGAVAPVLDGVQPFEFSAASRWARVRAESAGFAVFTQTSPKGA